MDPALCEFFGYDDATLKTKTWQELTDPDYLEADLEKAAEAIAGTIDSYRMIKAYVHADGHRIWGELAVGCVRDADGQISTFIAQINDITEEVEIRAQLAERDQQNRALAHRLSAEIKTAAAYVTSTLPSPIDGPITVTSSYLPAMELGGDCFHYAWIDEDLLLIYLIDVSGHGIGPALLSMSMHNLLRSGSLPIATLLRPERVLAKLNSLFPMEDQGGNYSTVWYGIYESTSRTLRYASGGHQPALALNITPDGRWRSTPLTTAGLPVGMFADSAFEGRTYTVPEGCRLLIFSDGAFEFTLPDGQQSTVAEFTALIEQLAQTANLNIETILDRLQHDAAYRTLEDDCSLILVEFDETEADGWPLPSGPPRRREHRRPGATRAS